MTEIIPPVNVITDTWLDLVNKVNSITVLFANNVVSTGAATTGTVNIIGALYANNIFAGSHKVVNELRQINTSSRLTGGGSLANNLTIDLSANTIASLDKADSAAGKAIAFAMIFGG